MLLSINIPTYERFQSFSSVIYELALELASLESSIKELVQIVIFDNNSICYLEKERLCKKLENQFQININIKKNSYNIGGDNNIQKCCIATPDSDFTWVLGDDDHVVAGSIGCIINLLRSNQDDLDLIIVSGIGYEIHPELLKNKHYDSYYDLAKKAVKLQPHFLIAHTLISCNIFRTCRYVESEGSYYIESLRCRYGHFMGFSHMRGLVSGLLRNNKRVFIFPRNIIDTGQRENDCDFGEQIFEVYYFYFLWLLTEIGIRLDQVKIDKSMYWLSRGIHFKLFLFGKRLSIKDRLKKVLIQIVGVEGFAKIRRKLKGKP